MDRSGLIRGSSVLKKHWRASLPTTDLSVGYSDLNCYWAVRLTAASLSLPITSFLPRIYHRWPGRGTITATRRSCSGCSCSTPGAPPPARASARLRGVLAQRGELAPAYLLQGCVIRLVEKVMESPGVTQPLGLRYQMRP